MVQRLKFFLLNSERGLWYDGRCGWFKNFESASHFRIESVSSDANSNLEASQVPTMKEHAGVSDVSDVIANTRHVEYKTSQVLFVVTCTEDCKHATTVW